MLTSNVVIWSPLLNFLVSFRLPLTPAPPPKAGCNSLELPLVVPEQFFQRLDGYVIITWNAVIWSFFVDFLVATWSITDWKDCNGLELPLVVRELFFWR